MSASDVIVRIIGYAGIVGGVWLLRTSWRAHSHNAWRLAIAWALIGSSIVAWSMTSSVEKGAALGVVCITIVVLGYLAVDWIEAPARVRRASAEKLGAAPERRQCAFYVRKVFAGVLMGPLSGISALLVTTATFAALASIGSEHTANLVLAMFLFPLAWAGLAVLVGADGLLWRKSLVVASLSAAPLLYLVAAG